jgi:hypothetical protein
MYRFMGHLGSARELEIGGERLKWRERAETGLLPSFLLHTFSFHSIPSSLIEPL